MDTSPITLRRASPRDAAAFARIMADADVQANLLQLPYPGVELWERRLADNDTPGNTTLALVAERGGEIVGSAGLHPVGPALRRRHVAMLGVSVASGHQGSGVGTALMRALTDYADRWGQILRIELTVFADNARAIALYERFGFEHEGRGRGYALRDGRYEDVLYMARLHPSPPAIR
jgi:L-phenylalanine/L-methionine N-acetyltransferase